jgi:DNA-binding MarR family transcriptional regulator
MLAMRSAIELLYFAYREFTADADAMLARYGFRRAHHRVIYFVGRQPGMSVRDLLAVLRITKQSLAPVLAELIRRGFIVQRADPGDRRRRKLYLSAEADALERRLSMRQAERLADAFAAAGEGASDGFCRVLRAMINPADRARFGA